MEATPRADCRGRSVAGAGFFGWCLPCAILANCCQTGYTPGMEEDVRVTTLNVSLPQTMRRWIAKYVSSHGYSSASEYVRSLIRADQKRAEEERLESLLMEGLADPPSTMTAKDWQEIRRDLRERIKTLKTRKRRG